jgi:hypothetical protein
LPLFTELGSGSRGTALGIAAMCVTVSRALATLIGVSLFDARGMSWVASTSAVAMLAGAALFWRAGDPGVQRLRLQPVDNVLDSDSNQDSSE